MDLSLIKQRMSCIDYAKISGIPVSKPGDRCASPIRSGADNRTAFVVYEDFWYDFVAQLGGDVIDLCALKQFDGNRGAAISHLARLTGVENEQNAKWVDYTQNLCNSVEKWHKALSAPHSDYLHRRGILQSTIDELKIGTKSGRIVIPYWKNGYICYYISRKDPDDKSDSPKYIKAKLDGSNENIPWGLPTLKAGQPLYIAEGAFDALSIYQEGKSVLATMGGHFSKPQLEQVRKAAEAASEVVLTFDNDEAGRSFTKALGEFLFNHRIRFSTLIIPSRYKDVSEHYEAEGRLPEKMQDGIEFLAKSFGEDEWDDFKTFAYKAGRVLDKSSISQLFSKVAQTGAFDAGALKDLKSDVTSCPAEGKIVSEIRDDLLYHPSVGFFTYDGARWARISDEEVKARIARALGRFKSGSKCNSILTLLKAETARVVEFNRQNKVNFINGTLNLDTLEFSGEHNPNNFLTYCMKYPYKPGKYYSPWSDFIEDIMNGDERKQSLMQEAAGYVLFPNNEFQRCFVLIGSGANGKSVFMNVLTAIFGEENVSNVEMSAFAKDFQVIHLMNSLINISSETKSNIAGAESVFKQIVAGDMVSSCYKGKDMISFRPRSKLFIACNEYMKSKDTTEGYLRRLCFIKFPMHYTDNPTQPNDRPINRNLEKDFMQHLTEIFNWVLDGYRALRADREFTVTDEQSGIVSEYKEVINPLISFVKDYELDGDYASNDEFYRDYTVWCEQCGHKARTKQSFLRAVPEILREYRKDIEKPLAPFSVGSVVMRGIRRVFTDCITVEQMEL